MKKNSRIFLYGFSAIIFFLSMVTFVRQDKAKAAENPCLSAADGDSVNYQNQSCRCINQEPTCCYDPGNGCALFSGNKDAFGAYTCSVTDAPDGASCGQDQFCENGKCMSSETFDSVCVEKINQDGTIVGKPAGASCSKNGFLGACDGVGHCLISPDAGCAINGVPQSSGVVCFIGEENGTCDGTGNCVIGGSGGGTPGNGGGDDPHPEICCNNADDDLDGMIDAQDSDCNQSKGAISLQTGTNNVCWQAKPWGMLAGSESQYDYTSPTFSCPTGYWVKLTGDYLIRDFEELYLIYPGGQTLPSGYGAGAQMPSGTGSLDSVFRASQLSLRYNSGGGPQAPFTSLALQQFGVLVSNIECVPQAASNDCNSCGDTGIWGGTLNPCDMNECYGIGGGPFYDGGQCFYQPSILGGQCYNKSPVNFLVKDVINQTPLSGVKVSIYSYDYLTCTTDNNGRCQIDMALGASFTAFVEDQNLDCPSPGCRKYFTPTLIPYEVVLEPYKIITCSDSDAGTQFTNGAKNYYQKGTASETYGNFTDICNNEQILKEYSCSNNQAVFEDYVCSLGCLNGRCLTAENQNLARVTFTVTAGGGPVAGVIVAAQGGIGYSCLTGYDGKCQIELVKDSYTAMVNDPFYLCQAPGCPKNFEAVGLDDFVNLVLQRKQIPGTTSSPYCHDTDGGKNYEEEGAVKVDKGWMSPIQSFLDYCFADGKTLKEGFCDGGFLGTTTNICAFACNNGACEEGGNQNFKVSDKITSSPLASALIETFDGKTPSESLNLSCSSNLNGECPIDLPPNTSFYASATKNGYYCENDICCQKLSSLSATTISLKMKPSSGMACSKEGEKVYLNCVGQSENQCCPGLTQLNTNKDFGTCVNCGDGVCTAPEDDFDCPQDCPKPCSDCIVVDDFGNRTSCKTEEDCSSFGDYCTIQDGECTEKNPSEVQQATLIFWVYDEAGGTVNKVPITGANVGVNLSSPTEKTCQTLTNGSCQLAVDIGKRYTVVVSAAGFQTSEPFFADPSQAIEYPFTTYLERPAPPPEPTPSNCSACGEGILNPCDQAECNALGACVFADGNCLDQDYWAALQALKNRVEYLENKIDETRDLLAASDLGSEQKQNLEERLDAIENELEAIRDLLPDYLFSLIPWKQLFFLREALAAADVDIDGTNEDLDDIASTLDDILDAIPGMSGYSNPVPLTKAEELIKNITRWFISILGSLALVMLIFSGFRYLTAGADESRATNAKKMITWTIIGLAIILGAAAIVNGLIAAFS